MLKQLTLSDVNSIIFAAEQLNASRSPSRLGLSIEEAWQSHRIPSLEQNELVNLVQNLSHEARMELLGVLWLGRGDSGKNYSSLLKYAQKWSNEGEVHYVAEKAPKLPQYLREGLKLLSQDAADRHPQPTEENINKTKKTNC